MSTSVGAGFLARRFDALYASDDAGRILRTNEWDPRPAPRFHLMRDGQGLAARYRFDLPVAIVGELERIVALKGADPTPSLPRQADAFRAILAEHGPATQVWSGPAYRFEPSAARAAAIRLIDHKTTELLAGRFDDWLRDVAHRQPFVAVVEDGRAVAICASVRITKALHCAGIETHPEFRRRGHAVAAAQAWAHEVRKRGAEPLYSTSWKNAGSLAVAGRLGLKHVATDFHIT